MTFENLNIFGLRIDKINYSELLSFIENSITSDAHFAIGYANAHLLNKIYTDRSLRDCINSFDVIHPDGIGAYWASRRLYKNNGLKERFTGSDFYPLLANEAIRKKWSIFFFGHDKKTLEKIKTNLPGLNIAGVNEGYGFTDADLIEKINKAMPQILVIGMPTPKQEMWLCRNKDKLHFNCALVTGDGIKLFAGSKIRGPKFIRDLGFEWLVRLIFNPVKYWNRYVFGIPLFLGRIFNKKLANLPKNR